MKESRYYRTKRQKHEIQMAWLFLLPCLLGFLVVRLLPTLFTFVLSLFNWDLIGTPTFAGFGLFEKMFSDKVFFRVMSQTFVYVVGCLVLRLGLGLVLSSVFHHGLRGADIYKSICFIPVIIPWAAAAVVWSFLFSQDVGPINYVLNLIGIPSVPWLTSKDVAMISLVIVSSWKQLGYRQSFLNPYCAAERGQVDDVILPAETRQKLLSALELLRLKPREAKAKRHGNMPL